MKESAKEKLFRFCKFCDSGKPWYFFFGTYLILFIVSVALLFTEEEKPSWWSILMNAGGLVWSAANIVKTEKLQKENADLA